MGRRYATLRESVSVTHAAKEFWVDRRQPNLRLIKPIYLNTPKERHSGLATAKHPCLSGD